MLAGLLLISICAGGLAAATALALSLPLWVAVIAYPLAGSGTLLICVVLAALLPLRSVASAAFQPSAARALSRR